MPEQPLSSAESSSAPQLLQQLITEATNLVSPDSPPEQQERLLQFMSAVEAARKELGQFCETIGTGKNRTVIFTSPVQRTADEKIDLSVLPNPATGTHGQRDMGIFHSTYREYGYVNRLGLGKVVVTQDRVGEIDHQSPAFLPDRSGSRSTWPEQVEAWARQCRKIIQQQAAMGDQAVRAIMRDGHYPPTPPAKLFDPLTRQLGKDKAQPWTYSGDQQYDTHLWRIGELLDPGSIYSATTPRAIDTNFDRRDRLDSFFTGAPIAIVRVTNPDFVKRVLQTSARNARPVRSTTVANQ